MNWNRLLSAAVAVCELVIMGWGADLPGALRGAGALVIPLACIWFGDEMGNLYITKFSTITDSSPGGVVRFVGWLVLVVLVVCTSISRFARWL